MNRQQLWRDISRPPEPMIFTALMFGVLLSILSDMSEVSTLVVPAIGIALSGLFIIVLFRLYHAVQTYRKGHSALLPALSIVALRILFDSLIATGIVGLIATSPLFH